MEKAYERVEWPFIIWVLRAFGFSEHWIDVIFRSISNCWFSPVVNGVASSYFKSHRGIRQGDSLSPTICIIAVEAFSRSLIKLGEVLRFGRYFSTSRCPVVTHLAFADDVILFCAGDKISVEGMLGVLRRYECTSGQRINKHKSMVFVHSKVSTNKREELGRWSGIKVSSDSFLNLGCPMSPGNRRADLFIQLIDKIKGRIEGWHKNMLSLGGRLIRYLWVALVHCFK
ncbi:uncharacterized protein M6B38_330560 [Iris pallida]|uniref:Reverse transcriptase domain-containing protein n=1 Tax=Iris pallida TaxID=29817 RepID=A0AAX6H4D5_IRIPA|nr:uncharacterized protein M6B38_330560 [Iris pallida]